MRRLKPHDPMFSGLTGMNKGRLKLLCIKIGCIIENGDTVSQIRKKIRTRMQELNGIPRKPA